MQSQEQKREVTDKRILALASVIANEDEYNALGVALGIELNTLGQILGNNQCKIKAAAIQILQTFRKKNADGYVAYIGLIKGLTEAELVFYPNNVWKTKYAIQCCLCKYDFCNLLSS